MAKRTSKAGSRYGVYVGSSTSPTLAYVSTKKLDANKAASKLKLSGRVGIKIKAVGPNPISGKVPAVGWRKEYAKAAYAAVKAPGARRKRAATTGKIRRALNPNTPEAYIKSLRSKAKQDYAKAYYKWLRGGQVGSSPDEGSLSYMAAQAVRMNLRELSGKKNPRRRNSAISIVGPSRARAVAKRSVNPAGDFSRRKTKRHWVKVIHQPGGKVRTFGYFDSVAAAEKFIESEARQATDEEWHSGESYFQIDNRRRNPGRKRNAASILMRRANPGSYLVAEHGRAVETTSTLQAAKTRAKAIIEQALASGQSSVLLQIKKDGRILGVLHGSRFKKGVKYTAAGRRKANPRTAPKSAAPRTRYMVQVGETPAWVGKLKSDANKAWKKLNAAGMKGLKIFKVQVNKVVKDGWRKAYKAAASTGAKRNPSFPGRKGSGQRFKACVATMSKRSGVYDPAGLCASIGRKKYGAKGMAKLAGKSRKRNPSYYAWDPKLHRRTAIIVNADSMSEAAEKWATRRWSGPDMAGHYVEVLVATPKTSSPTKFGVYL